MAHVVDYDEFAELRTRVEQVEAENRFLRDLITNQKWLTRGQALKALGVSSATLKKLTDSNHLTYHYEGAKPFYDINSVRNYLTVKKFDAKEIDNRVLVACFDTSTISRKPRVKS